MNSWIGRLTIALPIATLAVLVGQFGSSAAASAGTPAAIGVDPSQVHGNITSTVGGPNGSGTITTNFTADGWNSQLKVDVPGWVKGTADLSGGELAVDMSTRVPGATLIVRGTVGQDLGVTLKPDRLNGGQGTLAPRLVASVAPSVTLAAASSPQQGLLDAVASWAKKAAGFVLLALLLILILPGVNAGLKSTAHTDPWSSLGLGLVLVLILPLLAILVFALGLPLGLWWLGLVLLALYIVALLAGFVFAGIVLGRWALDRLGQESLAPVVAALLGLAVLAILTSLPYIGAVFTIGAAMFGMGALVLWSRAGPETPAAAVVPAAEPESSAVRATPLPAEAEVAIVAAVEVSDSPAELAGDIPPEVPHVAGSGDALGQPESSDAGATEKFAAADGEPMKHKTPPRSEKPRKPFPA